MHQRKSKLSAVAAASELLNSPPTPDLDPSISSCSSSFALGETNSQGSGSGGSANATATGNGGDNAVTVVKQEEFGGEKWETERNRRKREAEGVYPDGSSERLRRTLRRKERNLLPLPLPVCEMFAESEKQ